MSGHVEKVTVSRCGDWFHAEEDEHPGCPGDERGCSRCEESSPAPGKSWAEFDADQIDLEGEEREEWLDQPHPVELTHGEFIRQYGRCPDGCEVAEQLDIAGALA